jgi:glyoxylase-like metal-dependent hydrolase (beta-lactamase superfamily II)
MTRKLSFLAVLFVALITLGARTTSAQAVDARKALEAAAKAMGTTNLKSIQFTAEGFLSKVGEQYDLTTDWPHFEVSEYTRTIDFDAKYMRLDYNQKQGNYPTNGYPPVPENHVTNILSGNFAWDMNGDTPVPFTRLYLDGMPYCDLRQLEMVLTPHGFIKAALAATDATAIRQPIVGPSDFGLSMFGQWVTIVSFHYGKYRVNGTINDKNLVEFTGTWIANPVYGDMPYEMRYTQYKDYNGVMFPGLIHVHQGDPRINPGENYFQVYTKDVQPNLVVNKTPVPEAVRTAKLDPVKVETQKLANHVWLLGGGPMNSVLVEFKDFVAVVEAPQNEARSLAVMEEVHKLVPGKMIRYVVNTNHHMAYAGGLRTYFSQGTTVVTHQSNRDYYVDILFSPFPRTVDPDRMATFNPMYMISRRPPPIETVGGTTMIGKYVVSDDERQLQVWHVQDMAYEVGETYLKIPGPSLARGNHSADMLMVYLPKEKILINADLYVPPEAGGKPTPPTAGMRTLYLNMKKLDLDVAQHVSIVGERIGSNEEFVKLVGNVQ